MFLLANGWLIDACPQNGGQTVRDMGANFEGFRSVVDRLFPNHGTSSRAEFEAYIRTNYVRTVAQAVGISNEAATRIYGTAQNGSIIAATNMTQGDNRLFWFLFYPTGRMHDNTRYLGATAGEQVEQVYIFDTINLGYILSTVSSQALFLEWILSQGLLSHIDNARELFDPFNPVHILAQRGHGFNPTGAGPTTHDVIETLLLLGIDPSSLTEATMLQLSTLFSTRGGLYSQAHRAAGGSQAVFNTVSGWARPRGRGDLVWNARFEALPAADCSSLVIYGLRFGEGRAGYNTESIPTWTGATHRTANLNGSDIPSYLVQIHLDGSMHCNRTGMREQMQSMTAWRDSPHISIHPGDIFVRRLGSSGHTFTVVGVNQTGSSVTIPAHLNGRGRDITVAPGDFLSITTANYHSLHGFNLYSTWSDNDFRMFRPSFDNTANCS